jgi:transcriptional regulator with XRE-family HTH domain
MANEDIVIRFGKRIKKLRNSKGWTQSYMAVHTGLGRPFLSNLETGKKEPCLRSMEILAGAFDMSVSQLTRGL